MGIQVRQELESDFEAVFQVNVAAFGRVGEAQLVDQLRASDAFVPELSLVATEDEQVIGHILFTKIHIVGENLHETDSLALAPMAVMPEFQGLGVGSRLVWSGLDRARALGFQSVIVLGHAHYYPKFGFLPASKWGIRSPYDVPDHVFMATELVVDSLQNAAGRVRYSRPFATL